jgi:osmotically-inducible protein OsmY
MVAKDVIITLSGIVESFTKKLKAKDIVEKVAGVKIVLEGIELNFDSPDEKNDKEIATEVLSYFKWNWGDSSDKVKAKVENGLVTLEGNLQWDFLKDTVEKTVKKLVGEKVFQIILPLILNQKNEFKNHEIITIAPLLLANNVKLNNVTP